MESPVCLNGGGGVNSEVALSTSLGVEMPATLQTAAQLDPSVPSPLLAGTALPLLGETEVRGPSVMEGRLKNSEVLDNLNLFLSNLPYCDREDVISLIGSYENLFSDIPRRSTAIVQDIYVGDGRPTKQHAYCTNPQKRLQLQKELYVKEWYC